MSKELDFLLHQARFVGGLDPHTMPPSGVASHLRTLASAVMAYDEFNPAAPSASPVPCRMCGESNFRLGSHDQMLYCVNCGQDQGASPDLDRVKFHACLHCGWRGRRYERGPWLGAGPEKLCPECYQPVWEETVGITRAADDAGAERRRVDQRCSSGVSGHFGPFVDKNQNGDYRCAECGSVWCATCKDWWASESAHGMIHRRSVDGPSAEGRIASMAREAGIEAPIRPDSENEVSSPRSDDDVSTPAPFRSLDNWTLDALRKATAEREDAIRHKLIELGWTPPTGDSAGADLTEAVETLLDRVADLGIDTVNGPWSNDEMGDCGAAASAVRALMQAGVSADSTDREPTK